MHVLLGALLLLTAITTSCQFKVPQSGGLTIRTRREIEDAADGDESVETSKVVATSDDRDDPVAADGGLAQDEISQTENDDTDDNDDDEGAGAGTSSNDGPVPEDDEDDEPTSVNENGAVIYTSPNEKAVDIQESPKEGQIESAELDKVINGMDDEDDDDEDGDDDNDSDDNDDNGATDKSGDNKNDATGDNDADIKVDPLNDNVDDNDNGSGEDKKEINLSVESDDSGDTSDSQSDSDNSSDDQSDSEDTPKDAAAEPDSADTSDDNSASDKTSDSQPDSGAEDVVGESDSDDNSDNQSGSGDAPQDVVAESDSDNTSDKQPDSSDSSDEQSDTGDSSDKQSGLGDAPQDVVAESDSDNASDKHSDSDDTADKQSGSGDTDEDILAADTSDSQSDSDDTSSSGSGDTTQDVVAESDSDSQSDSADTSDNQSDSKDTPVDVAESDSDDTSDSHSDSGDISNEQSGSEDAPEDVVAESDSDDTSDNQSDSDDTSDNQSESRDTAEDILAADTSDSQSDSDDTSDNQSDSDDTSDSQSKSVDTSKDVVADSDSDNPPDNQPDSGDRSDEQSGSGDTPQDVVAESDSDNTSDRQSDSDDTSDKKSDSGDTADEQSGSEDAPQDVVAESDSDDTSDTQSDSDDTSDTQSDSDDTSDKQSDSDDTSDKQSDSDDTSDKQSDSGDTAEDMLSADTSDSQPNSDDTSDNQSDFGDTSNKQSDSEETAEDSVPAETPDNQSDSSETPDSQPDDVVADSEDTSENQSDPDDNQSDPDYNQSDPDDNQSDPDDTSDNQSDSDPDSKSSTGDTPEDVVANSGDTADTESDSGDTADTESDSGDTESDSGDTADTQSDSGDTTDTESDSGDTADTESDSKDDSDALPDSEDSTAQNTDNVAKLRKKRLALANPLKRWPKAIFPYSYSNSLSENGKKNSLAAMGYMSRYTCMKFVPYKGQKTNTDLGLGHPGHLIFANAGGCWSYVGLLRRAQGQVVSCMTRTIFIHEIGHTAFMLHEQVGENRKGLIRINYENIANSWKSQYRSVPAKGTLSYIGYDMSSMTHYPINMGSKNGRPAMSVLYEAPEFHVGGNMYYMMAEINKGYSCTAKDCPELDKKCLMDSYAVKRDGKCECVCVGGLDPATHCAKPKKAARKVEGWGPGKMAMFKPKSGCPDGMSDGTLNQEGDISGSTSAFFPLDGTVGAKTSLGTCIMDGGTGKWPQGRYCFIQAGDHCPEGFESGGFKLGKKDGGINELNFCCKDDGYDYETIQMKNEAPFTLFMKHRMCQVIEDMKSYSGWVFLDATSISIEGSLPVNNIAWRINAVKLHYCYYVPLKYGCGEAIELTDANPTAEISTPNYPDNYPQSTSCTWIVSTPDTDSVIVLDFDDSTFCVEKGDHVDIHSSRIGQPPTRVRGKGYKPSVITLYNKLKIQFMSDMETECSGFKAKLRMVKKEDQSYLLDDAGSSYRGTVSFTHNKLPCLPWSQMASCPHHSLASGDENDGLESNYCRNPGDGIAPWCYIYEDNCERNYCDVSLIGRAADNYPDCEEIVSKNPDFCKDKNNAMRGCFKTCQDSIKYERNPKKAGEITCSKPNVLPDSEIVDVKDSYKLGESVLYQCSYGPGEVERVCTTTGDWTPAAYACGECGNGWQTFNGACYRYVANPETYTNAKAHCEKLKAKITSIRSEEESDFVTSLADPGTSQWLGMTARLYGGYKYYTWDDKNDGVMGRYTNWRKTPVLFRLKKRRNAIMLGNMQMKWKIVRDKKYKPWFPFTCKKPSGKRPCLDTLRNCQETATEVRDACHRYQQWANNMCRKTCGVCGHPSDCDVPKPAAGSMVDLITKGTKVKAGHAVHYKCADDYTVSKGKLTLTCLDTGKLAGLPPACVAKSSVVRLSNDNDIHARSGVFGNLHTYTGSGEQYTIDAGGKVIGWQFYAQRAGSTVFQVWRHTGEDPTLLKFIGQNEIKVKTIRLHNVSIPVSDQIAVDSGDIIGIWNPQGSAGVPYNNYVLEGQHGLRLSQRIWSKDEFSSDIEYRFVEENPVKTMSFKAILGPA